MYMSLEMRTETVTLLKHISQEITLIPDLEGAGTMKSMIRLLLMHEGQIAHVRYDLDKVSHPSKEIQNHILAVLYNLCHQNNLSRDSMLSHPGVLKRFMRVAQSTMAARQFVLPVICSAASTVEGRRSLWTERGLDFLLWLLDDVFWRGSAFEALAVWYSIAKYILIFTLHS